MNIVYWGSSAIILFLIALASYFISDKIYDRLVKAGKRSAKAIRVLTFVFSFVLIFAVIWAIIIMNLQFIR
jgi:predicted PurR-regulated permease PerM